MTKKLIEISNKKANLEKQVITLKHLNIQPEKQVMSSKKQTKKENIVGIVIGQQDGTPGKLRHRQAVIGKEKQMGEAIYVTECTGKTINDGKLREIIKQDGGLRKLEIRKSAEGNEGNVGIAYFETNDQAIKTIETLRNKVKHFQTTENKNINGQNTKGEKIEGLTCKRRQKKVVKVIQIIKKMSFM